MGYTDQVLLPHGVRLKIAICETMLTGKCLTEARIDWPDSTGLASEIRLGLHSYDRSYNQLYVAVNGCNVSITSGGGDDLLFTAEVVDDVGCEDLAIVAIGSSTWFR